MRQFQQSATVQEAARLHRDSITTVAYLGGGAFRSCMSEHQKQVAAEFCRKHFTTHGKTKTKEFLIWQNMLRRCNHRANPAYANYGGRGISVCMAWHYFDVFLYDMGKCPKGMSLERIDNGGNYEIKNCRWANRIEQANNTRANRWLTCFGKRMTLSQWSRHTGLPVSTISMRIDHYQWRLERALTSCVQ